MAKDLGVVEGEVEELTERLVDEPRAVDDELERIALRIAGIHGPRVAVVQWDEVRVPLGHEALLHAAQRGEIRKPKRQLENRRAPTAPGYGPVEDGSLGPTRGKHQLMMFTRIGREEDKPIRPAGNGAAVRYGHAEDSRVEVFQAGQVEAAQPDVAERKLPACDVWYGCHCHLHLSKIDLRAVTPLGLRARYEFSIPWIGTALSISLHRVQFSRIVEAMAVEKASPPKHAHPGTRGTGRVERRRARTRQRILEVAEELVRSRGIEAVTIDEITEAADIARRSFYLHFDSKHDLLVPVAQARTRSLNRSIDRLIEKLSDPAEIVSIGLRHTFRGILDDPLCCWFILRSGLPLDRLREGIGESAARDLERGTRTGRFVIPNQAVLGDVLSGAVVGVLSAYLGGSRTEADLDDAVEYVLRLLGVPPAEAHKITHGPLPPLPPTRRQSRQKPTKRKGT